MSESSRPCAMAVNVLVKFSNALGYERVSLAAGICHAQLVPIDIAIVVPLTSRGRGLEHHVRIDSVESGLARPSWAHTEDITAESTRHFRRSRPRVRRPRMRSSVCRSGCGRWSCSRPDQVRCAWPGPARGHGTHQRSAAAPAPRAAADHLPARPVGACAPPAGW